MWDVVRSIDIVEALKFRRRIFFSDDTRMPFEPKNSIFAIAQLSWLKFFKIFFVFSLTDRIIRSPFEEPAAQTSRLLEIAAAVIIPSSLYTFGLLPPEDVMMLFIFEKNFVFLGSAVCACYFSETWGISNMSPFLHPMIRYWGQDLRAVRSPGP